MKVEEIKIDGMTCHSCEEILENSIKSIDGVLSVEASIKNRSIKIEYNKNKFNKTEMIKVIEKKGYTIKKDNDTSFYMGVIILLFTGYLIIKRLGGFNFIPNIDDTMGYGILFIIGILTSLHCIAMCGGINISVCMANGKENKFKPGLLYNLGRITSYTVIGGIIGGIGSVIGFSDKAANMVSIFAGIFMVLLGINMLGIFKKIGLSFPIPKKFRYILNNKKRKTSSPYVIGLINGFMPCGPLQTMQIYALGTGSVIRGALSMFAFSVGTAPLMLTISFVSSILSGKMGVKFKKVGALLVIVLGIGMFNRGFDFNSLFSFNPDSLRNKNVEFAVINDEYQEVITRFENGRYQAIAVQKDIPVRWVIKAETGDINGCNNEIIISEYDIRKELQIGENIVEFLPQKTGSIRYFCWMYMLSSNIYIVDDIISVQ